MTMTKCKTIELDSPVGDYLYNVQVWNSVDGINYYYTGAGRFCKTKAEADTYITDYEKGRL